MGIHLSGKMPISLPAGITIVQAQSDGGNPDGNGDNESGFENAAVPATSAKAAMAPRATVTATAVVKPMTVRGNDGEALIQAPNIDPTCR